MIQFQLQKLKQGLDVKSFFNAEYEYIITKSSMNGKIDVDMFRCTVSRVHYYREW